jgi:A/G-specific adenine glycosylase
MRRAKLPRPTDLAPLLLDWYDANRRDLPWRRTSDPYRIWVSEIMLQQTQVETALPYYERFLARFPTVADLAKAPLDEVLKLWAGLGYYSRARNLHAAAQVIMREHGGRFPNDLRAALALPGVGAYTAGAILSIAYGKPLPALDGNVRRVLARVFLLQGDLDRGEPKRALQSLTHQAVPQERPGDHNQALMELGALVCVPGAPRCEACPLSRLCAARQMGVQTDLPAPRPALSHPVQVVAGIVSRGERILIARRPIQNASVWAGLWEFPQVEYDEDCEPADALAAFLSEQFGLTLAVGETLARLRYGITNRRIALEVKNCRVRAGRLRPRFHVEARWVRPEELEGYALPAPHRRICHKLEYFAGPGG